MVKRTRKKVSVDALVGHKPVGAIYKPKTLPPLQLDMRNVKAHMNAASGCWWALVYAKASVSTELVHPTGSVGTDNANGHLLSAYAGDKRRSVSWTHRGMEEASTVALHMRWG